jgi:membrane-associated protease RseP (regulator of RpoE activity)
VTPNGFQEPAPPTRYWLHAVLFISTALTTTLVGARMQRDFQHNLPFMGMEEVWSIFSDWSSDPVPLWMGLPFSFTLLTILLMHELGHYAACVYYRLNASLPYFLPAPVLIGTFGAFIRIRSPLHSRKALFDVAFAGPAAGFLFLIPALGVGLALSKIVPGIGGEHQVYFGTPALLWVGQNLVFPGVPSADIYLHPIARAANIGLLATAWNLIPIGQLDGGHILYSMAGTAHRRLSIAFILLLIPLGLKFWPGWLIWAALLYFVRRHPPVYDTLPIGRERKRLAWVAALLFALSFTVIPFEDVSGF